MQHAEQLDRQHNHQQGALTRMGTHRTTTAPRVLLTVEAAAERLSISRSRMYLLIKKGDVFSVRVGKLRRIPSDALTDYVRHLTAHTAA